MGWFWKAIWVLVLAALEFLGTKYDWVKEEIESKPRNDVM
jgi:hypothetical protein